MFCSLRQFLSVWEIQELEVRKNQIYKEFIRVKHLWRRMGRGGRKMQENLHTTNWIWHLWKEWAEEGGLGRKSPNCHGPVRTSQPGHWVTPKEILPTNENHAGQDWPSSSALFRLSHWVRAALKSVTFLLTSAVDLETVALEAVNSLLITHSSFFMKGTLPRQP